MYFKLFDEKLVSFILYFVVMIESSRGRGLFDIDKLTHTLQRLMLVYSDVSFKVTANVCFLFVWVMSAEVFSCKFNYRISAGDESCFDTEIG